MKDNLILQDKNYISAKRASVIFGYTSDYVGQLCRSGKLECKMIGRSWFVSEESVIKHREEVNSDHSNKKTSLVTPQIITDRALVVLPLPVFFKSPSIFVKNIPSVIQLGGSVAVLSTRTVEPLVFVPSIFSIPEVMTKSFLQTPYEYVNGVSTVSTNNFDSSVRLTLGLGITMIAFVFLFQSLSFSNNKNNFFVASVLSSSQNVISKVFSFFSNKNNSLVEVETPPPKNNLNGLVVVPSTNSPDQDELLKQRIRNTFSDEVQVNPDVSGTAGIIKPVFRKAKSDDFVYVMVPLSTQLKN